MNERKTKKAASKSWFIDSSDSEPELVRPTEARGNGKKRPRPTASSGSGKQTRGAAQAAEREATSGENEVEPLSENVYLCFICGKDITALSVALREAHVNACIDSGEGAGGGGRTAARTTATGAASTAMSGTGEGAGNSHKRAKRAKGAVSAEDEQMQLAKAISLSECPISYPVNDEDEAARITSKLSEIEGKIAQLKKQKQKLLKTLKTLHMKKPAATATSTAASICIDTESAMSLVFSPRPKFQPAGIYREPVRRKLKLPDTDERDGEQHKEGSDEFGVASNKARTAVSLWEMASLDGAICDDLSNDLLAQLVREFRYTAPPPFPPAATTLDGAVAAGASNVEHGAVDDLTDGGYQRTAGIGCNLSQFLEIIDAHVPVAEAAHANAEAEHDSHTTHEESAPLHSPRTAVSLVELWQRRVTPEVLEHFPNAKENIQFVFEQDLPSLVSGQAELAKKAKRQLLRLLQHRQQAAHSPCRGTSRALFLSQLSDAERDPEQLDDAGRALLGSVYAVVFFLGVFNDGIQQALLRQAASTHASSSSSREASDDDAEEGGSGGNDQKEPHAVDLTEDLGRADEPAAEPADEPAAAELGEVDAMPPFEEEDEFGEAYITYDPVEEPPLGLRQPDEYQLQTQVPSSLSQSQPTPATEASSQVAAKSTPAARAFSQTLVSPSASAASSEISHTQVDSQAQSGMPPYSAMSDEELVAQMKKYGMKPQPRKKMVQSLEHIWRRLHGEEASVPAATSSMNMVSAITGKRVSKKQRTAGTRTDQGLTINQQSATTADLQAPRQDLTAAVIAFLHSAPELHQKMLLYEPIVVDDFLTAFSQSQAAQMVSTRFSKKELLAVLDAQNVFLTAFVRKNRRQKRS